MRSHWLASLVVGVLLVACGSSQETSDSSYGGVAPGGGASTGGGDAMGGGDMAAPGESSGAAPGSSPGQGNGQVQAGLLTAGAWDDNRNFDFFTIFRDATYATKQPGLLPIDTSQFLKAHERFATPPAARTTLDISLVIDTTGSMGDELAFLQKEFESISSSVQKRYPGASPRWSLVVYRDEGDEYVTRSFDFTQDAADFRQKLGAQRVDGGGDFPEAPDAALALASTLAWRSDDATAKLAFWVADAPHHDERAQAFADAVASLQQRNVHVYPVASSGIDELTELSMRSTAQLTGGRYLFLTNDSGIGDSHKEPTIPCYFVTRLDQALERMVDIEMSGTYREPEASEVIRAAGNPTSGACQLDGGKTVRVF